MGCVIIVFGATMLTSGQRAALVTLVANGEHRMVTRAAHAITQKYKNAHVVELSESGETALVRWTLEGLGPKTTADD